MIPTTSLKEIAVTLCHTFLGNPNSFKIATECLAQAQKIRGFCMAMMETVDDVSFPVEVKQAALIKLKNTIKHSWANQSQGIDKNQKQSIRSKLIQAIMRCHGNHKLIKLYKEILTIIVGYDYRIWLPGMQIREILQEKRDTTTVLHILLAIADSFEQCVAQEQKQYFFEFLKIVLPALQNLLQRRPQPELTYLSIKFLYKATHCKLSPELKQITCRSMGLLTKIVGSTNPKYDQHPEDFQARETEEFYYFHSKKWATRILLRFIEKHASSQVLNKQDNKLFSEQWYSTYGANLIDALIKQFSIPTSKKVRYFQLKCVHALILQKPETMKHYAVNFQFKFLLDYLGLQRKDYQRANKEPLQFIFEEEQSSNSNTNLRKVATDVWVAFASLGSKDVENTQTSSPGMFLFASMNYLQSKLENRSNPLEKELAMYLLCKLSPELIKYQQVRNTLLYFLSNYILPELTSQVMFLRVRALDIFRQLGSLELNSYLVTQAVEGIFVCLTINPSPLVRIKAAQAFNCILKHNIAKDLVRPILWYVFSFYFELLNYYDSQNICKSLQSVVQNFAYETIPFSVVLVKYLTQLFFNFFNKDRQSEQQEYKNYLQKAAASYLRTIKTIISSSIPSEYAPTIEADIFLIIQYTMNKQDPKFMQLALDVLNAFLLKVPQMSSQIQFLHKVVVFNMVGITKTVWLNIQKIEMPLNYLNIMRNISNVQNIKMMERSIPVLRNYIKKSSVNTESNHLLIKSNIVQILFYLISQIYKRPLSNSDGQYQIECCTNLLICLLQNYQKTLPQLAYIYVYEYIKINITKFKGKKLKVYTSQLIGLLLWVEPILALKLANRDGLLSIFLKQLVSYTNYKNKLQRARVILGINSLLLLPDQKYPALTQHMPQLFRTAVILVQKNAQQRIDSQNQVQGEKREQCGKEQDEDEEVFRQIENQDKYEVPLCSIDQILQFKATTEKLSCEQTQMYSELLETVGAKDWAIFKEKITKALEKAGHKFN